MGYDQRANNQKGAAMIDRYTRPEMGHIFSLENKYAIWQDIEVCLLYTSDAADE